MVRVESGGSLKRQTARMTWLFDSQIAARSDFITSMGDGAWQRG
jgi:hypothetical protein